MLESFAIANTPDNIVAVTKPDATTYSFKVGDMVTADVMDIIESGMAALRIIPATYKSESQESKLLRERNQPPLIVRAKSNVPLNKGDKVLLKVVGGEDSLQFRFMGAKRDMASPDATGAIIPREIFRILSRLSGSRLKSSDFRLLRESFEALPESVKSKFPEFKALENLIPKIEHLNNQAFKGSVEGSGILFETRLKLLALTDLQRKSSETTVGKWKNLSSDELNTLRSILFKHSGGLAEDHDGAVEAAFRNLGREESEAARPILSKLGIQLKDGGSEGSGTLQSLKLSQKEMAALKEALFVNISVKSRGGVPVAGQELPAQAGLKGNANPGETKGALNEAITPPEKGVTGNSELSNKSQQSTEGAEGNRDLKRGIEMAAREDVAKSQLFTTKTDSGATLNKVLISDLTDQSGQKTGQSAEKEGLEHAGREGIAKSELSKEVLKQTEVDQKALLLKIKELLNNEELSETLKNSGFKHEEIANTVDRFIKNIEYFQLTSKVNDMLYTFLPLSWPQLRDGELLFRKNRYSGTKSYTCDINLDLDYLGKLNISATVYDNDFYLSFQAEKTETKQLINTGREDLQERFLKAGLPLKVVNVGEKRDISLGKTKREGIDLKV